MADTLDRLLDRYGPDAQAVVWAHNTHVGDARATDMAADGMVNIGQLARERHGDETRWSWSASAATGARVVAAPRWGSPAEAMVVPPAREGSVERAAARAAAGAGACWSSAATTSRTGSPRTADHRAIGVVYDPSFESWGNYVPTRLGDRYDAFIWCDDTTALHPLPAPGRPRRDGDVPGRRLTGGPRLGRSCSCGARTSGLDRWCGGTTTP